MLAEGSVIGGKYRLVRSLGEGGMGSVWAAHNELIGRDVAVKVMLPHLAQNKEALRRFFNEARICAGLRNPGIVDVLDMGSADDGSPFIVMELLNGKPLDAVFAISGALRANWLVPIVRDVAQTLATAHEHGVVHRDLKPANVFLNVGPENAFVAKILDFGVSKVVTDAAPSVTRTGAVVGSPAYMSPEQAAGKPIDFRTDIYSLGVILYEGLAGRIPFEEAQNANAMLVALATTEPPALASVSKDVPPYVLEIVDKAMRRDREERFGSAQEMFEALRAASLRLAGQSLPQTGAAAAGDPISSFDFEFAPTAVSKQSGQLPPATVADRPHGRTPHAGANTSAPFSTTNGVGEPRSRRMRALVIGSAVFAMMGVAAVIFAIRATRPPPATGGATSTASSAIIATSETAASLPSPSPVVVASAAAEPLSEPAMTGSSEAAVSDGPAASVSSAPGNGGHRVPPPRLRQGGRHTPPTAPPTATARHPSADDFK